MKNALLATLFVFAASAMAQGADPAPAAPSAAPADAPATPAPKKAMKKHKGKKDKAPPKEGM